MGGGPEYDGPTTILTLPAELNDSIKAVAHRLHLNPRNWPPMRLPSTSKTCGARGKSKLSRKAENPPSRSPK